MFLVLAQARAGISCFLVPRVLEDGSRNPFAIQRLKDKLGNRSNASSEVEFDATHGWLIGEEGRGVQTIVEMVNHTRLDCILGSAGLLRQALAQAIHHATYRRTFGKLLIDHPLMQNVLADLALESEAATALFARIARSIDESDRDPQAVGAQAHRHRGRQILRLQARAGRRRRSAGMSGRQRLRRGIDFAAPLSRVAAQLHLGGFGQHQRARRAAHRPEAARVAGRAPSGNRAHARRSAHGGRRARARSRTSRHRRTGSSRAIHRGAFGAAVAGFAAACSMRRTRFRMHSSSAASPGIGDARWARCRPARPCARSSIGRRREVPALRPARAPVGATPVDRPRAAHRVARPHRANGDRDRAADRHGVHGLHHLGHRVARAARRRRTKRS